MQSLGVEDHTVLQEVSVGSVQRKEEGNAYIDGWNILKPVRQMICNWGSLPNSLGKDFFLKHRTFLECCLQLGNYYLKFKVRHCTHTDCSTSSAIIPATPQHMTALPPSWLLASLPLSGYLIGTALQASQPLSWHILWFPFFKPFSACPSVTVPLNYALPSKSVCFPGNPIVRVLPPKDLQVFFMVMA